jgi:hypothetical protein
MIINNAIAEACPEDIVITILKKSYFKRLKLSSKSFDAQLENELNLIEDAIRERQRRLSENKATQNNDTDT